MRIVMRKPYKHTMSYLFLPQILDLCAYQADYQHRIWFFLQDCMKICNTDNN